MKTFIIDLVFERETGAVEILLDWTDPSMTMLDIEEGIADGSLAREVIEQARAALGDDLAEQLVSGALPLVCLDKDTAQKREVGALLRSVPLEQTGGAPPLRKDQVTQEERQSLENQA